MRAELAKLLALYSDVEESCGCASLSLSTSGGKSIVKFTLETPPPPVTTTSSRSPTSPSAPGNPFGGRVSSGRGEKETRRKYASSKWWHWGVRGKLCGKWGLHNWPVAHSGRTRSYLLLGDVAMTSHVVIEDSIIYQVLTLGGPDRRPAQEGNVEFFIT